MATEQEHQQALMYKDPETRAFFIQNQVIQRQLDELREFYRREKEYSEACRKCNRNHAKEVRELKKEIEALKYQLKEKNDN